MRNGTSVVAAGHELTASAAAEILEDGGNAFDAALAARAVELRGVRVRDDDA